MPKHLTTDNASEADLTELTDGSETALHSHAGGGGGSPGEYLTYTWAFEDVVNSYSDNVSGSGQVLQLNAGMRLVTGATSGSHAYVLAKDNALFFASGGLFDKYGELITSMNVATIATGSGQEFYYMNSIGGILGGLTAKHYGIYIVTTSGTPTIRASHGDGTTHTTTDISGTAGTPANNTAYRYRVVFDPGVDIKYYVNGVLCATHTTNLPTGASADDSNFSWHYIRNDTAHTNQVYIAQTNFISGY